MTWRGSTTTGDRILAALPYLLVLSFGLSFGYFVLTLLPRALTTTLFLLVAPVQRLYQFFGPLSILIFLGLYFFVVRNENIKHFIRFNTMQALLINIALVLIQLIFSLLPGLSQLVLVYAAINSLIFLAVLVIVIFSVTQTLRGIYADIPKISEAVYLQVP